MELWLVFLLSIWLFPSRIMLCLVFPDGIDGTGTYVLGFWCASNFDFDGDDCDCMNGLTELALLTY